MNWLTIPNAPNYEINAKLQCRNKKTGYVMKKHKDKRGHPYYSLRIDGSRRCFQRSPKFLYRLAKDAVTDSSYEPIPSLDNRYEIDEHGHVRNARTKLPIKPKISGTAKHFCFQMGKHEYVSKALSDLLWEAHGVIKKRRFKPCPASCENEHGKYFFGNMKACARFLEPKVYFSWRTIYDKYLTRRKENVFGWKITYLDNDFCHNDFALANVKGKTRR